MTRLTISLLFFMFFFSNSGHADQLIYKLDNAVILPSTNTPWDYIKLEPEGNRLFMARVADGLSVFDVDRQSVIKTQENSIDANGPLIIPGHNRLYVAMADGSILTVELDSLKTLKRSQLTEGVGLNSAVYDPQNDRVYAITGTQESSSTWYILDASSGELLSRKSFPFGKMDDPATDGKGRLFAPARYDNLILVLDANDDLAELERWQTPCYISKVHYEPTMKHLFAACFGDDALLLVYDTESGRELARFAIGPIMDSLAFDTINKRIVTANGGDATLTVVQQSEAGEYRLLGNVGTRPGARMMQIDQRNGQLYLVYADFTRLATGDGSPGKSKTFHPDSFTVLTYKPD